MKAKLPKAVWVGFDGEMNPINAVCDKRNYRLCHRLARYHLHPGNEVARALNIIRGDVWYYNLNTTDKDIAATLRDNGIPVRWDAKKGRFV